MTSPISAEARQWVRARATEVMEYTCQITRGGVPEGYDEDTLVYTAAGVSQIVYEGVCRIWELAGASAIMVGDADIYQQATQLSIPWDTPEVIKRYDEVDHPDGAAGQPDGGQALRDPDRREGR